MSLRFRLAVTADAEAVSELVNSAYRGESSKAGWTTEAGLLGGQRTDPESLRGLLVDPSQAIWLAFENDLLVGSVNLEKHDGRCYLGMLAVRPTLQARGLGRRLIEHAEEFARHEWRAKSMFMTVISVRTELIEYYERRGYRRTGEAKEFPMDDPKFGLPKRRDFNLVVLEKVL